MWEEFSAPGILRLISLPSARSAGDCWKGRAGDSSGACRCSFPCQTAKDATPFLSPQQADTPARTCWSPSPRSQFANDCAQHHSWLDGIREEMEVPRLGLQAEDPQERHHVKVQGPPVTAPTILLGPAASLLLPSQQKTKVKAGELYPISSINRNYCPFFLIICLSVSETGSPVALNSLCTKDDLELLPLLPALPECWDYRHVLLHGLRTLGIQPAHARGPSIH